MTPDLLPFLVCPLSRGWLEWQESRSLLISRLAEIAYPRRDGVPVLLIEEAINWPPDATDRAA